jgi:arylsulfatase A-like enzyme
VRTGAPFIFALLIATTVAHAADAPTTRPNVLIILIDDHPSNLNDVDQKSPVPTPNMRRLAGRGTWFSRGYNDAPICCASRTALLTGVHATRSGIYYNNIAYKRAPNFIAKAITLPQQFMRNGYLTAGYGKIPHNAFVNDDIGDYTPGYYKALNNPGDVTHPEAELAQHIIPGSLQEIPGRAARNWSWGVLPDDWDRDDPSKLQQDTEQANRTIALLRAEQDRPFFMICGLYRPHGPWTVAKRYYDRFPLESIEIPAGYRADDLEDLPKPGRWIATNRGEHAEVVAAGKWKRCIQAVYAATAYADEQIGRILDALEASRYNDNTIVIFADDNGFHLGEKDHWLKFALWEQTCRVVFSMSVPGMPVQRSATPVSLIDIYPTLNALCHLSPPETHELDGIDLSEVLAAGARIEAQPVLSTYGWGNHSLRNDRYRYIRYRNGAEELYDDQADPYEWHNLAGDPKYAEAKAELAKSLPKVEAPDFVKPPPALLHATWEDEAFKE